jgi:inner membrane protein
MPSIGHIAVGLAAARMERTPPRFSRWSWALWLTTLSLLPDADVLAFSLGIPYRAPFGHRGAFHSIAFALIVGTLVWAGAAALRLPAAFRLSLVGGLVVASHGLLDTLTDGGKGIALLWPFSNERYFAPWRPIPVAPIGAGLFTDAGIRLVIHEAVLFLPVWLVAVWPTAWTTRSGTRPYAPAVHRRPDENGRCPSP